MWRSAAGSQRVKAKYKRMNMQVSMLAARIYKTARILSLKRCKLFKRYTEKINGRKPWNRILRIKLQQVCKMTCLIDLCGGYQTLWCQRIPLPKERQSQSSGEGADPHKHLVLHRICHSSKASNLKNKNKKNKSISKTKTLMNPSTNQANMIRERPNSRPFKLELTPIVTRLLSVQSQPR